MFHKFTLRILSATSTFGLGLIQAIARTLAKIIETGTITIVDGGDSVGAVEKVRVAKEMSHISTGGDASFELLEGKILPAIATLNDA